MIIVNDEGKEFMKGIKDTLYKNFGIQAEKTCNTIDKMLVDLKDYKKEEIVKVVEGSIKDCFKELNNNKKEEAVEVKKIVE